MKFHKLKNSISIIAKSTLGGLDAQFKLAPKLRTKYTEDNIASLNPKKAAVLALFYPDNEENARILLTLRASYEGTHSSQISFPGGKIELHDNSLKDTALRETYEEVGIEQNKITVFKEMTNVFIPPSNFLVKPFLGYTDSIPNFEKNHEVAKIIEVKLTDLLNDSSITSTKLSTSYAKKMIVPCFMLNDYVVWGATAMMLSEIRELFKNL
jgi:8-oxo-dGTP pyrophosphatase MutT (NUDIX family)